ncbi:MAG: hypothetical protein JJ848_008185 [Prochlorococcus marinus CUG1439]|uniref:hypothetical protein n=1 Tax=Prochlorococcus sp. MIT 1314 TaxID=3096220 RepID=UPI001B08C9B2|nr:hypothetical protein [Prochlorococcus sp. MIT 1314]MCR8540314.1 hypothetical protein [Prochlorococcus marinus CUG1439]
MTNDLEKLTKSLLKTSRAIKSHKWNTFQELKTLLIQESQLMIKLVMVMGFDLALRNQYFVKRGKS